MGGVCSGDAVNSRIDENLLKKNSEENAVRKLLLLGSGSAGKSTIVKQLTRIHKGSFDSLQNEQTAMTIQSNCIQCIIILLKNSALLYERDNNTYRDCYINIDESPELSEKISFILANKDLTNDKRTHTTEEEAVMKAMGKAIADIWKIKAIQTTFSLRGGRFSFIENMDYFFQKAETVMDFSYAPSDEDVVYARERTAGIVVSAFSFEDCAINIVDVGGQRNERSKWIHAFDCVDAIVYVAALNHFNVVLFEDESVNAMHESLELFNEVVNGKWFAKTELILFLNKHDLFVEELQSGHSLSTCFGEDAFGWKGPDYWTNEMKATYDFDPGHPNASETHYLKVCVDTAIAFIENQYAQRSQSDTRELYTHITCATDKNNVEKVFWDVQEIVIKAGLRKNNIL